MLGTPFSFPIPQRAQPVIASALCPLYGPCLPYLTSGKSPSLGPEHEGQGGRLLPAPSSVSSSTERRFTPGKEPLRNSDTWPILFRGNLRTNTCRISRNKTERRPLIPLRPPVLPPSPQRAGLARKTGCTESKARSAHPPRAGDSHERPPATQRPGVRTGRPPPDTPGWQLPVESLGPGRGGSDRSWPRTLGGGQARPAPPGRAARRRPPGTRSPPTNFRVEHLPRMRGQHRHHHPAGLPWPYHYVPSM